MVLGKSWTMIFSYSICKRHSARRGDEEWTENDCSHWFRCVCLSKIDVSDKTIRIRSNRHCISLARSRRVQWIMNDVWCVLTFVFISSNVILRWYWHLKVSIKLWIWKKDQNVAHKELNGRVNEINLNTDISHSMWTIAGSPRPEGHPMNRVQHAQSTGIIFYFAAYIFMRRFLRPE